MYTALLCEGCHCKRLFTVGGTSYTGEIFKSLINKGAFFDRDWHAVCNKRDIPAEAGQIDITERKNEQPASEALCEVPRSGQP